MDYSIKPISVSTSFSLVLHALAAIAIWQTQQVMQAAGPGLEIELVSSTFVSSQDETERAARKTETSSNRPRTVETSASAFTETAIEPQTEETVPAGSQDTYRAAVQSDSINNDSGEQISTRSTGSSRQKESLIELLHSKISEHKRYPFLAKRQRREGVATVEFVLHPDGSVQNPRLLQSSRTSSLDKAALNAVKSIEPFTLAGSFIDRPEAYRVDVVFNFR